MTMQGISNVLQRLLQQLLRKAKRQKVPCLRP